MMGGAQGFEGLGEEVITAEVTGFEGEVQALRGCNRSGIGHGRTPQHSRSIWWPKAQQRKPNSHIVTRKNALKQPKLVFALSQSCDLGRSIQDRNE
jgi:hypothetical protein